MFSKQFEIQELDFASNIGSNGQREVQTKTEVVYLQWQIRQEMGCWVAHLFIESRTAAIQVLKRWDIPYIQDRQIYTVLRFNRQQDFAWTRELAGFLQEDFLGQFDPGEFITHNKACKYVDRFAEDLTKF